MSSEQTITITDVHGQSPVTLPVHPRVDREGACLDLILEQQVHIGCPVVVRISLRTDGSCVIWQVTFDGSANHYAHIVPKMNGTTRDGRDVVPIATEAQKLTVARWWSGVARPCGLEGGCGRSVLEWAFAGLTLDQISDTYLEGRKVAVA